MCDIVTDGFKGEVTAAFGAAMEPLHSLVIICENDDQQHMLLSGEFDFLEVADLRQRVQPLLDQPPPRLTLNLANVDYIGAAGTRVLQELRDAIYRAGGTMRITDTSSIAARVLHTSAFEELIAAGR